MLFLVVLSTLALAHGSVIPHIVPVRAPQPYKFGYSIKDHHGEQHREESGNGAGAVVGNYGFTDDRGIARQVNYVADHAGFRAQVKTNEPGTANQNPAAVQVISNTPYVAGVSAYVPAMVGHPACWIWLWFFGWECTFWCRQLSTGISWWCYQRI
ncbi:hypothetical protein CEXT_232241 [Caerostris extrusa]|uniref:Cuticle protein 16.8 n=1 Tax=Caerostris extrusa TaxID=172846 RepID=A0AAV4R1Z7_CAEEX|nr:hypothetical protein CEXT_232241 [Caerostris extrusa]